MDTGDSLTDAVKTLALEAGFLRVGITPAGPVPHAEAFKAWLAEGCHAGMTYMAANVQKRLRPDRLVPGAKSVICLAASYPGANVPDRAEPRQAATASLPLRGERNTKNNQPIPGPPAGPFIARYARGGDYHKILKRRCRTLMDRMRRLAPGFEGRAFVDSAPVMERSLAAAAGVGWVGRNAMLIVPGVGSYVLLCEIVCNLPLSPDQPVASQCVDCRACVAACPTGAIRPDGLVDARKCLSYLTIEHRDSIGREFWLLLGDRVFGCDTCQEGCPHNRDAAGLPAAAPAGAPLTLAEILNWTREDWDAATRGSARRRASREMFLRNACLAAGNSGDPSLRGLLESLRRRAGELGEEIDWALDRLR